jgi:hypothetical protein
MVSVVENIKSIVEESLKLNHDTMRHITEMKIGQVIRQGDVYVKKVKEIPSEYSIATMEMQIARGETKGSRHSLQDSYSLRIFKKFSPGPLDGPAFTSTEEILLTHPEHPDFKLPCGNYVSYYQQDFAQAEIRAVKD